MEKLDQATDGSSMDIVQDNIAKLKQLFPDVFSEGKIDFEKLQETLGEYTEDKEERYNFTWHGKTQAKRIAQTISTGTLLPCKEESKNWDSTQNLFIEGDNLEVLKLLQKSYHNQVKMIYIDPPYNTGKEFIYPDNYRDNLDTYMQYTGQKDNEGKKFGTNADTSGRYHTNWLNMMYPRLKLARNLLRDDGCVFISIDENEVSNLRKLCDEIFGEENFRNTISVRRGIKNVQAQFDDISSLSSGHEYILVYSKNTTVRLPKLVISHSSAKPGKWDTFWRGTDRKTMRYELFGITPTKGQWRWEENRTKEAAENYLYYLESQSEHLSLDEWYTDNLTSNNIKLNFVRKNDGGTVQYYVPPSEGKLLSDNWMDILLSGNETEFFDTEKSLLLLKRIVNWISSKSNDIILDFFSGSCTSAHAVMDLNAQDNGHRKHIMVQLPEPCDKKSEAYKAGYKTIADIGKERIRRAGEKILQDSADKEGIGTGNSSCISSTSTVHGGRNLDIGFKVFKLDSSNIKPWDADFDNLEDTLLSHVDNIKPDRSEEDVLYEILLKYGLNLTDPIEERNIHGKTVYSIGFGALIVCLDDEITLDVVDGIGALKEELEPEVMRVVFKDSGFNDVLKTNAIQNLKRFGIDDVKSL